MSQEHAAAYDELRLRVAGVLREAGPSAMELPSPATPAWRVHDVVAHMVGVTDDVVAGRLDGVATEPWTAAQVDARRNATFAELLAEWDEKGPAFATLMADVPGEIAGQAVFDAATHEQDIRTALGMPGARDCEAIAISWDWAVDARTRGGAPALRFVTEAGDAVAGAGEPAATVTTTRYELVRAMTGRRTRDQIERYAWDPTPLVELLIPSPLFTMRTEPLDE
jgi:uncharacterized protein (TIGR03083 family)